MTSQSINQTHIGGIVYSDYASVKTCDWLWENYDRGIVTKNSNIFPIIGFKSINKIDIYLLGAEYLEVYPVNQELPGYRSMSFVSVF